MSHTRMLLDEAARYAKQELPSGYRVDILVTQLAEALQGLLDDGEAWNFSRRNAEAHTAWDLWNLEQGRIATAPITPEFAGGFHLGVSAATRQARRSA